MVCGSVRISLSVCISESPNFLEGGHILNIDPVHRTLLYLVLWKEY